MRASRAPRAALLVAAAGAIAVLLPYGGWIAEVSGLAAILAGTLLSAPPEHELGAGWWRLLTRGALIAAVGVGLGFLLASVGGLIAAIGAAMVVVAACLAF